ncbi:hypothetical protein C8Q80DRAFT_1137411 [Daedaleopsis nitida]|nr:hypothetical protein C8Q80DRAFT_1137411 [Daedaleopsis nitida]
MFKTSYQIRPVSGEYSCPRPTVWNVDELPLCKVHRRGLSALSQEAPEAASEERHPPSHRGRQDLPRPDNSRESIAEGP